MADPIQMPNFLRVTGVNFSKPLDLDETWDYSYVDKYTRKMEFSVKCNKRYRIRYKVTPQVYLRFSVPVLKRFYYKDGASYYPSSDFVWPIVEYSGAEGEVFLNLYRMPFTIYDWDTRTSMQSHPDAPDGKKYSREYTNAVLIFYEFPSMQVGPYYTSVWENTPFRIEVSDPIAKAHQITHYADSRVLLLSDWEEHPKTNDEYRVHTPMTTRTQMGAWVETFTAWRIELEGSITRAYAFQQANCGNMDWETEVWQNGAWESV